MTIPRRCSFLAFGIANAVLAQFGPAQVLYRTPGANSRSLEAHDMNADGVPDLLMGTGRGVFVNFGLGGGAFGEPEPIIEDDASEHVAVAIDIDGDAYTDVAYGSNTTGALAYLLSNGGNGFGVNMVLAPNGYRVFGLWAVDWDNDGDKDLMVAREYNLILHRNNGGMLGSAEFMIGPNFERPAADFADIDGDGWIDVVVGGWSSSTIQYHRNTGGGQPQFMGVLHTGNETGPADIEVVDIDGDGDQDVLASLLTENELHYYLNDGGAFGTTWGELYSDSDAPESFESGDIDGDGDADLLSAAYDGYGVGVRLNNGDGTWTVLDLEYHSFDVYAVALADLNGDDALDICFSSYGDGRVAVALNDGSGTYPATEETVPCFGEAMRIETTDLNGDDRPDVIVASYEPDAVAYALSQPGGGLGEFQQLQGVFREDYAAASSFAFADMDEDGDMDILRAVHEPGALWLYSNQGGGQFGAPDSLFPIQAVRGIAAGDLTGDGLPDLAFVGSLKGFYRNLGNGVLGSPKYFSVSVSTNGVYGGITLPDLDQDGDLDILFWGEQLMYWRENTGTWPIGNIPCTVINSWITDYVDADLGDVDGDGDLDILAVNNDFGTVTLAIYTQNANNTFTIGTDFGFVEWSYTFDATFMDVDGDGDEDVVMVHRMSLEDLEDEGVRVVFLNDGAGNFGPGIGETIGIRWPYWCEAMDMDQDGDEDLLIASWLDHALYFSTSFAGSPYQVQGRLFYDTNGDGVNDQTEPPLPYQHITFAPAGSFPFSGPDGGYSVACDIGDHTVCETMDPALWTRTTATQCITSNVSAGTPISTSNDFGFLPANETTDATAWYVANSVTCGADATHWAGVSNEGNTTLRGTLELTLDPAFTFVSSDVTPTSVNGNVIIWAIDSLAWFDHAIFPLHVVAPGPSAMGDEVVCQVVFHSLDGMGTPNGTFAGGWSETVTCSYDPNRKSVEPRGFSTAGYVPLDTERLTYTIEFQNTGTATAEDVVLIDPLDPVLDPATMRILGSSHTITQVFVGPDHIALFRFDGILLPDSGANEPASHGFVRFDIKPMTGLANGTEVRNHVGIVFDQNIPVYTDTTLNTFIDCSLYSATISTLDGSHLIAHTGTDHQWFLDGLPIPEATQSDHFPVANGSYTVSLVNPFGCALTSEPYLLLTLSTMESSVLRMAVSPNPVRSACVVRFAEPLGSDAQIELLDMQGRCVIRAFGNGSREFAFDRGGLASGVYQLHVARNGERLGSARIALD